MQTQKEMDRFINLVKNLQRIGFYNSGLSLTFIYFEVQTLIPESSQATLTNLIQLSAEERKKRRSEVEDYDKVCGGSVVKGKKPNFHGKVRRSWIPLKQVPYAPFMDDWNDYVAHVKVM